MDIDRLRSIMKIVQPIVSSYSSEGSPTGTRCKKKYRGTGRHIPRQILKKLSDLAIEEREDSQRNSN